MGIKTIERVAAGVLSTNKDMRAKARQFRHVLMLWANRHGRSLPWRETADSYRTLIAELMLQRTRSDQVVPVYQRFVQKYPHIAALASASLADLEVVLRPLGLAFRARTFLRLARRITEDYGGRVPLRAEEAVRLPGVGPYVASALDAFLTNRRIAAVDANIARVMARVFGIGGEKWRSATAAERRVVHEAAGMCLGRSTPRAYHYALLDFAAAVCSPKRPACPECPMHKAGICSYCAAHR
jgi:A/G-specific adenine glycosylase